MEINNYSFDLYTKQNDKYLKVNTIHGYTIEEILRILDELELEKIYNMDLTMNNLSKWYDLYKKEIEKSMQESINKMIKNTINKEE